MKKFFLIILTLALTSCSTLRIVDNQGQKKQLDPKLVGSWNGFEKDNQEKGLEKHWIQHRFNDGSFVLLFILIENGHVSKLAEKGKWWTENGVFYEFHENSQLTDAYEYTILDEDRVKFKVKSIEVKHENPEYEFIDTRL